MKRCSPTLEAFQTLFLLPSLGLAEIVWRWSFGLAVTVLLALSVREFLATLPVTGAEIFLLQTRQPPLVLQAISKIFKGSAPRVIAVLILLTPMLTAAWIVLASFGRAATLKTLFAHFRGSDDLKDRSWRFSPLLWLNFLRAIVLFVALLGLAGAGLLAGAASPKNDPSPGGVFLIFWMLSMFIGLAWYVLNWYLSLAAIFVIGYVKTTFGALSAAADLCHDHPGALVASTTCFDIVHAVAFVIASSASAVPLAFAEVLPGAMVLGGMILVALLYFAVADLLHVGRLTAYVFVAENPQGVSSTPQQPALSTRLSTSPSLDEDNILSDIPGLVPPPHPAS